jgi:hypothetical protein
VPHLHSLQSYTFVTAITYTLTLSDFSAINYCLKLSHTLHLHTLKLSPRSYSANSLLKTLLENCSLQTPTYKLTRRTAPYKLFLTTNCLDISVPLINSQSYKCHCSSEQGESCVASGHCVYTALPRKRSYWRVTSSRQRGEDPASPTAAQRVLGREAFSGRLPSNALLRNPTMGWHVTIWYLFPYFVTVNHLGPFQLSFSACLLQIPELTPLVNALSQQQPRWLLCASHCCKEAQWELSKIQVIFFYTSHTAF